METWVSGKEEHVIYGLPEGAYILHEELAPFEEGYVTAGDVDFQVKADGSVAEVEMKDDISKVEIKKTDITTGKELKGAKLQVLTTEGTVLEEWITDGSPHKVNQLPVGVDLILREVTAPEGYEVAEDVVFKLEDTAEIQKVEMKDKGIEKKPVVSQGPKTGDRIEVLLIIAVLCSAAALIIAGIVYKKKRGRKINGKKYKGSQNVE
ncbi:MSCRAMM family protein [Faecalicatena contorta]|uniref:MSCRAMM family protein n=1 Tax=Faecalicatena contorta TaxID=39482 RepID=UPI003B5058F4